MEKGTSGKKLSLIKKHQNFNYPVYLSVICTFSLFSWNPRPLVNGVMQKTNGVKQKTNGVKQKTNGVKQKTNGVMQKTNGVKQNTYGVKQKINGVKQNTNGVMQSSCGAKHKISEGKQFAKKVRQSVNGGKKNLNWQIREGKRAIRSIWKEVFTTWSRKKKLRKAKNRREGFIFMDSW